MSFQALHSRSSWLAWVGRTVVSSWLPSRPLRDLAALDSSAPCRSASESSASPDVFWEDRCPSRGPGLRHKHSRSCAEEHTDHWDDQCCECGQRAGHVVTRVAKAPDDDPLKGLKYEERVRLMRVAEGVAKGYYKP